MKRLFAAFIAIMLLVTSVSARTVSGSVVCGKKKLPGVIVTDGTNFTTTGKNGKFTFDIQDSAAFVYIITPSGYAADWSSGVPAFYQKASGKDDFVFELKSLGSADKYNILAVGDPQPRSDAQFDEMAGRPLDDIVRTAESIDGLTVGIVLGDVCYDKLHLLPKWKQQVVRTGIPFYTAPGNHDHDMAYKDDVQSINAYRDILGPENYALFLGDDIMIVLDNIIYDGGRSSYKEGYTDAVLDWVEGLLEHIDDDADIYVAQHSPLNGRNNRKMVIGHERMLDILSGHNVSFLSGHNHIHGNFEYAENVREHNVAALCGTWWDTYHCKDGTPRGYKVFTKDEDGLRWYYKSVDRDRNFQFEIFAPGQCRNNPESVVVNVWDYDPCWRVEWFEDGVYKGLMMQVDEYSPLHEKEIFDVYDAKGRKASEYKKTIPARHYFAAIPSENTTDFMVKVTDRFGNVWTETLPLK